MHAVLERLRSEPGAVVELQIARREEGPVGEILAIAQKNRIKVRRVPRDALDRLLRGVNHQGVAARIAAATYADFEQVLDGRPDLWVALDQVTDPGNLGAILRSAWAFGAGGVIIPKHRSAGFTPVTVKTAAGAAGQVPLCRVGNLSKALDRLKDAGCWVYGAALEGSQDLAAVQFERPTVIVMGAEGSGIRPGVRKRCDVLFKIPMRAAARSVNVSVAAGIVLAELYRR